MIKNIRDHKKTPLLLFFCFVSSHTIFSKPEIIIQNLKPASIEQLQIFSKNNPGAFTIQFIPEKKWLEAVTGLLAAPFATLRNSLSLKNISLTLISGALSLGWFSYILCTYLIYKTYRALKNIHSWVNWCSDDDLLSDYDALYRKFDHHKRTRTSTKKPTLALMTLHQEKELLTAYLSVDSFLRKHHLRAHFPYADTLTQMLINRAYAKLEKAETLLSMRKKKTMTRS